MTIKDISMEPKANGDTVLTITVDGDRGIIAETVAKAGKDPAKEPYLLDIKRARKRRSLDANAYAWVLIDKLAAKLGLTTTEVYREAIKEIPGVSAIIPVKHEAVNMLMKGWTHKGLGWQAESFPSDIEGFTNVKLYYGSSAYDSWQMSALIDQLVAECKAQGIETITPDALARMLEAANAYHN